MSKYKMRLSENRTLPVLRLLAYSNSSEPMQSNILT